VSAAEHAKVTEQEALKEEIQRRSALLEKKETAYTAQSRLLEAAEQKIRDLVRSEGEAAYKSRTLSAKLTTTQKALDEVTLQKKSLERSVTKGQQDIDKLRFELQAVNQKLSALEERAQTRNQSTDQLDRKNRDLESKLARSTSKIDLYRGKVETLQRQLSDKDTEGVLIQQKLELAMREHDRLRKELDDNRESARDYRLNRTELEETAYQVQRALTETEEVVERQRVATEKLTQERDAARAETDQLSSQLRAAQKARKDQEQQVEELLEQLEALEQYHTEETEALHQEIAQREEAEKELQSALSRETAQDSEVCARLQSEKEELIAEKERLEADAGAMSADLLNKKRQILELTRWAERVRPAYETLKQKFSDLQGEYRTLHTGFRDSRLKGEHQTKQIEALQESERARLEDLELLTEQLEELQQNLDASETDAKQKGSELELLREQVDGLQTDLDEARNRMQSSQAGTQQVEGELQELTDLLEEATQERLELDQKLAQTLTELAHHQQQYELLEVQLSTSNKRATRLEHELTQQQSHTTKAQSNLKELLRQRGQLLDAKKLLEEALAEAQSKEERLLERVNEIELERDRAVVALDELQTEFEGVNRNWIDRIKELESTLDVVNKQLDQERADRAALEAQSEQERSSFEGQIESLRAELFQSQESQSALTEHVDEISEVLEFAQNRVEELEQELRSQTEETRRAEERLAQSQLEIDSLTKELGEANGRLQKVGAELEHNHKVLVKRTEERNQLVQSFEAAVKQNKGLRELVARSQKESLGLRDYIEKLQALSKERLEQARVAIEKRDQQLKSQMTALKDSQAEASRLKRRLERTQLSEAALKGALTDLRVQLMEKDEMVEELEWHLGLLYQTMEDGQTDLEGKETELAQLTNELESAESNFESSVKRIEELESLLAFKTEEVAELNQSVQDFERKLTLSNDEIAEQASEFKRVNFHLTRTTARLERVLADLTDEQERSARLGAQLSDALEDRNKRVHRLRELQREFSEWRSDGDDETVGKQSEQIDELTQDLSESQGRELELQQALLELRGSLAEQQRLREESEQKLEASERTLQPIPAADGSQPAESAPPAFEDWSKGVTTGIDLGSQVLAAQMDLLKVSERRDSLNEMMSQVETQDSLTELLEELRQCDEVRQHKSELLEALESEWQQFCEALLPQTRELLDRVISIISTEMKQSRAAEDRVALLQSQISGASPDGDTDLQGLEELLSERTLLVNELEEELAAVSLRLTEATAQLVERQPDSEPQEVSWVETQALREELREKSELLERYREERLKVRPAGHDSLEEELINLNSRYQKGRQRIMELLRELEERDRMLSAVSGQISGNSPAQELESGEDDEHVASLLSVDEFELPIPSLEDISGAELEELSAPDFALKEETVEDLPAIPYLEEVSVASADDVPTADEGSAQDDSQAAIQDS
jgi:chromosome segregation ATPase